MTETRTPTVDSLTMSIAQQVRILTAFTLTDEEYATLRQMDEDIGDLLDSLEDPTP